MFMAFLKRLIILLGFILLCTMICFPDDILTRTCGLAWFLTAVFLMWRDTPENTQKSTQQDTSRQPFANNKYWEDITSRKAELYQERYMRLVKKYAPEFGSYGLSQVCATKYIDDLAQNGFAVKSLEIWYKQDKKPFLGVIKSFNKKHLSVDHATANIGLTRFFHEVPKKFLLRHEPVFESIADVKNVILQFPEKIEFISIHPHVPDKWLEKED